MVIQGKYKGFLLFVFKGFVNNTKQMVLEGGSFKILTYFVLFVTWLGTELQARSLRKGTEYRNQPEAYETGSICVSFDSFKNAIRKKS